MEKLIEIVQLITEHSVGKNPFCVIRNILILPSCEKESRQ